jgi:hypothetical protein
VTSNSEFQFFFSPANRVPSVAHIEDYGFDEYESESAAAPPSGLSSAQSDPFLEETQANSFTEEAQQNMEHPTAFAAQTQLDPFTAEAQHDPFAEELQNDPFAAEIESDTFSTQAATKTQQDISLPTETDPVRTDFNLKEEDDGISVSSSDLNASTPAPTTHIGFNRSDLDSSSDLSPSAKARKNPADQWAPAATRADNDWGDESEITGIG